MAYLIAMSLHTAHRFQEIGVIIAGLGAIALIVAGAMGLRRARGADSDPAQERIWTLVAGVLLGIGLLVLLIGIHR